MPGRIFFARVDALGEPLASALTVPDAPRHEGLAEIAAGDFLLLVMADGPIRVIAAQCDVAQPPARVAAHWQFSGRTRYFSPPKMLPLAAAHRFLHDGAHGPADLPGADEGEKIDAALNESRCVFDPKIRGSVPKIIQFWRWLESGESEVH